MARLARLGLGSGLGGKASAVGELLGLELLALELLALELLRRSSELLGPGSQKLLLGLLGCSRGMVGDLLRQVRDTGLAGPPPHAILRRDDVLLLASDGRRRR